MTERAAPYETTVLGPPECTEWSATYSETADAWTVTYWLTTPPILATAETFGQALDHVQAELLRRQTAERRFLDWFFRRGE